MFEEDLLYGFNSVIIAVTLFVLIILANEAENRKGHRKITKEYQWKIK